MTSDARSIDGCTAAALSETLDLLGSPAAISTIAADCYWPKWDGPWWRMLLLHEAGLTRLIPRAPVRALATELADFVPFFALSPAEVPPGKDPVRDLACHCQLG
ncbi:MAG: hypothetical protein ACYC8T_16440 [Myxococcaceae bacterium]